MGGSGTNIPFMSPYIYLAGSFGSGATTLHYRYDIAGDSWAAMAPVPTPVYEPAAGSVGGLAYIMGGGTPSFSVLGRFIQKVSGTAPSALNTTYGYRFSQDFWEPGRL